MRKNFLTALIIFLVLFAAIGFAGRGLAQSWFGGGALSDGVIAQLNIEGVITAGSAGGSVLGGEVGASSPYICELLHQMRDDTSVKGVLLRVNSPGGSAAGSDEIFHAVQALREAGKPVVVSMGDVAASGGYYISAPASYIYANGATLTGSIGVIFELLNWEEAAGKLGIRSETLHAGEFKDIGSPWRDMTDKERSMFRAVLDEVHTQFIRAVDEGRENLDEPAVRKLATGMIYTGEQATANGLIDAVGGLTDAEAKARELASLAEDAPIIQWGVMSFWDSLFAVRAPAAPLDAAVRELAAQPLSALARGFYLNSTLRSMVIR